MKIIATDFDGTLCENNFPEIGEPKIGVIEELLKEQQSGAKIILWTCREGQTLTDAVKWCLSRGIVFDAINDNLPDSKEFLKYNSRKVYATEYWDDRGIQK